MGTGFAKFVEWSTECKYVPQSSCCCICNKKLGVFFTGFWSVNVKRYNLYLSDGILCVKCREKAERYIKSKNKWMNKEMKRFPALATMKAEGFAFYSTEDIKSLITYKEICDKEKLQEYGSGATGLFEIRTSFGLETSPFTVGVFRFGKIHNKTVLYGSSEYGTFQKGDCIKIECEDKIIETTVLEAHGSDGNVINNRNPDAVFFEKLRANLRYNRKVKENNHGWMIIDVVWKHTMNGYSVIKISG